MEVLAQIVLNGQGEKLIQTQSREPEIQAFLNNVPAYMVRIIASIARTNIDNYK